MKPTGPLISDPCDKSVAPDWAKVWTVAPGARGSLSGSHAACSANTTYMKLWNDKKTQELYENKAGRDTVQAPPTDWLLLTIPSAWFS